MTATPEPESEPEATTLPLETVQTAKSGRVQIFRVHYQK